MDAINQELDLSDFGEGMHEPRLRVINSKTAMSSVVTKQIIIDLNGKNITVKPDQGADKGALLVTDGMTTTFEPVHDSEKHTLTFETDKFFTYVIAYEPKEGSGLNLQLSRKKRIR